ncbi:ATP-binding cassette domain-containing protein [Microbacterium saperdae]
MSDLQPRHPSPERGLDVTALTLDAGGRRVVAGVDLHVDPGECLGIVGESGSGKSLTLRGIAGLISSPLRLASGTVTIDGAEGARGRRGAREGVSMVFQDPAAALDPLIRVGSQIAAVRRRVRGRTAVDARRDAIDLLGPCTCQSPTC